MKFSISTIALGLIGSGLALRTASAATRSASFGVSATVEASCAVSASTMSVAARAEGNGRVAVSLACSHSVPYSVVISGGSANRVALATAALTRSGSDLWTATLVSSSLQSADTGRTAGADSIAVTVTY